MLDRQQGLYQRIHIKIVIAGIGLMGFTMAERLLAHGGEAAIIQRMHDFRKSSINGALRKVLKRLPYPLEYQSTNQPQ